MKHVFVAALVWSGMMWVTVCYMPSHFLYRSDLRVFVFQLCVDAVTYIMAARALLTWRPFEPMPAPWAAKTGNTTHQFFVWCFARFFIIGLFACLQAFYASESNPISAVVPTPCGSSSCSAELDVGGRIYNPSGFFSAASTQQYTAYRPTICLYSSCYWADGNGAGIQGYAAEGARPGYPNYTAPCAVTPTPTFPPSCLATDRARDYPNLAIGNAGGMFPGFGTLVTPALCPGSVVNPFTLTVKGRAPCAYCLSFFERHYNYTNAETSYCPFNSEAADNWVWCDALCPGLGEDRTPSAMLHQSLYTAISTTIFMIVWFVVHFAWFVLEATKPPVPLAKVAQQ